MGIGGVILTVIGTLVALAILASAITWLLEKLAESFKD